MKTLKLTKKVPGKKTGKSAVLTKKPPYKKSKGTKIV